MMLCPTAACRHKCKLTGEYVTRDGLRYKRLWHCEKCAITFASVETVKFFTRDERERIDEFLAGAAPAIDPATVQPAAIKPPKKLSEFADVRTAEEVREERKRKYQRLTARRASKTGAAGDM